MNPYHFANALKRIALLAAMFFMVNLAIAQTITETNSTIGMLSGQRATNVAKLAAVKQEIQTFTVEVMEPHNKDAAEQKRQLDALVSAGYDPYSQASVDSYNKKIDQLNTWGDRIDERKERETPRYVDMKTRETDYTQKIDDLESRIKALVNQYTTDCSGSTMEEIVNCWAMYFDGESKRASLPAAVPLGTRFFSQGVPDNAVETFKTYRNKQLDDIDHKKINVPAPEPPQKGMIQQATEKAQSVLDNIINSSKRKMLRVASAVIAVRG